MAHPGVLKGGGTTPGGGDNGNSGSRDNSSSGGGRGSSPQLQSYSIVTQIVGKAAAEANGMQPGLYIGYMVDDYGNVVGLFSEGNENANS